MKQDVSQLLHLLDRTKELQPGVKTVSPNGKLFDIEYADVRRSFLREAFSAARPKCEEAQGCQRGVSSNVYRNDKTPAH